MRSVQCVLLVSGLAARAAAASSSEVNCITVLGPRLVDPIETFTAESTSTASLPDATTTTAVTATVTGEASTETETTTLEITTTTTEDAMTSTYTSTSTETDTITTTTTSVVTTTETKTSVVTSTGTATIAAPSGFVAIDDTVNGFPARKRDSHRRHCHKATLPKPSQYPTPINAAVYSTAAVSSPSNGACSLGESTQYPASVECSVTTTTQATITETETSTETVTPSPVTVTATSTVTSTSTEVPQASTTVTETSTATTTATATATSTTTETTTSTSTTLEASATTFAACGPNNILAGYQNLPIVNVFNNGNGQLTGATIIDVASNIASAIDCCTACFKKDGCTGSVFPSGGGGSCYLMHDNARSCASQSANQALFITGSSGDPSRGYTLSNGPCGYQQYSPVQ